METGKVTEFKAGQKITVTWIDTIAHPGHFRIALAKNRSDLKDPDIKQDSSCMYDEKMVPKGPHDNVLDDGVAFRSATGFSAQAGMMFSDEVTLPNEPCDNCTLQVMQIMENDIQAISNCYYFHCANIKITAADGTGTAGSGAAAGSSASTAGSSATAGASGSSTTAGGSGGATASSAGKSGSSTGSAGSSTTPTSTSAAGKSGSTPTTGTTSSGQTAAAGSKSSAGSPAAPSGGTAGAGTTTTPAASPAEKSGGCSVTHVAGTSNDLFAFGLSTIVAAAFARRFKKRSGRRQLES